MSNFTYHIMPITSIRSHRTQNKERKSHHYREPHINRRLIRPFLVVSARVYSMRIGNMTITRAVKNQLVEEKYQTSRSSKRAKANEEESASLTAAVVMVRARREIGGAATSPFGPSQMTTFTVAAVCLVKTTLRQWVQSSLSTADKRRRRHPLSDDENC